jgi:hypothetical protein
MDVYLIFLLVCIILPLANGFKIKTVIYRVRSKQQDVRKCAMDILNDVSFSLSINETFRLFQLQLHNTYK